MIPRHEQRIARARLPQGNAEAKHAGHHRTDEQRCEPKTRAGDQRGYEMQRNHADYGADDQEKDAEKERMIFRFAANPAGAIERYRWQHLNQNLDQETNNQEEEIVQPARSLT